MNLVLDAGADDLRNDGENWEVVTAPESLHTVQEAITKSGLPTVSTALAMLPKNTVPVEGANVGRLLKLTEALEDHDDVQNVFSNFDIDEKELEALA